MAQTIQQNIIFEWRDISLAGTLHLPSTAGPHPAVLMLQGSGPGDRDADGFFPQIRDTFLSHGIAVYSFDRPGCGSSTGDWRHYALYDRTDQAVAALDLLRKHEAIDAQRVGVWGHSQGGWLVQMLGAQDQTLAFVIANSGAAITVDEQNLAGCAQTMRESGKSDEEIAQALVFLDAMHSAARRGDDYDTANRQLLAAARGQSWYGYLDIADADDWGLMCRFASEEYEPATALRRIRSSFLAVYGALDPLVPAWQSAGITSTALREAGNPDVTIAIFPNGNHRMLVKKDGEFVTGYLDLLGDWAARRAGTA
jgi:pimeloyl-ACP methyl ester carboxylesterase